MSDPCGPWSRWKETGKYRGSGDDWEAEEKKTRTCGTETEEQLRWVDTEKPIEVWPDTWTSLDQHQGSGQERQVRQVQVSNLGNKKYRWWPDPENTPTPPVKPPVTPPVTPPVAKPKKPDNPPPPPQTEVWPQNWTDTGRHRGSGQEREKEQKKVSNLGNTRTRWVSWPDTSKPKPPPNPTTPWTDWTDTGKHKGSGQERQKEQARTRTNRFGETDRETRWVADPENTPTPPVTPRTPTWGPWSSWTDTGNTRGTDEYREKEQSRTRTRSDGQVQTQKRWVTDE